MRSFRVSLLACTLAVPGATRTAPADDLPALPASFTANLLLVNAPVSGAARVRITIERWSTEAERQMLPQARGDGGVRGLTDAMERVQAGFIQIDRNLRWPPRTAVTRHSTEGRKVRVSTNRPIDLRETWRGTRSLDYPFGLAEFLLPAAGAGEGPSSPPAPPASERTVAWRSAACRRGPARSVSRGCGSGPASLHRARPGLFAVVSSGAASGGVAP